MSCASPEGFAAFLTVFVRSGCCRGHGERGERLFTPGAAGVAVAAGKVPASVVFCVRIWTPDCCHRRHHRHHRYWQQATSGARSHNRSAQIFPPVLWWPRHRMQYFASIVVVPQTPHLCRCCRPRRDLLLPSYDPSSAARFVPLLCSYFILPDSKIQPPVTAGPILDAPLPDRWVPPGSWWVSGAVTGVPCPEFGAPGGAPLLLFAYHLHRFISVVKAFPTSSPFSVPPRDPPPPPAAAAGSQSSIRTHNEQPACTTGLAQQYTPPGRQPRLPYPAPTQAAAA